jgi:hypothetical protein
VHEQGLHLQALPANLASYNQPDQLISAIIKSKNIDVLLQREISNCMHILSPATIDQAAGDLSSCSMQYS